MSRKPSPLVLGVALGLACAGFGVSAAAQTQDPAQEPAQDPVQDAAQNPAPATAAAVAAPARGMTMSQVEARFGAPAERHAPVGQPPITRWVYGDKVVYFEYDHVVHAVVVRR